MTVTLYNLTCEKKVVDKTNYLSSPYIPGNAVKFEGEQNVRSPHFMLASQTKPTYNYCYIAEFRRYYFLSDPEWIGNGVWEYQCLKDPLMSHKDYIFNLRGVVTRREDAGHTLLPDERLVADNISSTDITRVSLLAVNPELKFDIQDENTSNNIVLAVVNNNDGSPIPVSIVGLLSTYSSLFANLDPNFYYKTYYYDAECRNEGGASFYYPYVNGRYVDGVLCEVWDSNVADWNNPGTPNHSINLSRSGSYINGYSSWQSNTPIDMTIVGQGGTTSIRFSITFDNAVVWQYYIKAKVVV